MAYMIHLCKLYDSLLKNIKFGFSEVDLPHPLESSGQFSLNNPISKQQASIFVTNRIRIAISIKKIFKISTV